MRFEVLKYFIVLAEELHFGRAAERLAMTQPPLSTAIKSLEEELGVLLFERNKTIVRLTAAGAAFRIEANKILDGISRARNVVKSIGEGMVGTLDIGFSPTLIFHDILKIVDQFNKERPEIKIVLHDIPSSEQFALLIDGKLDAGFTYGSTIPPQLESISLKEESYVLCLPEGHHKAHEPVVTLREMAHESFLMFSRDVNPVNHDNVISMLSGAGIYPRFAHFTRSWMTMLALVSEGHGIGIVPSSMARLRAGGVRLVPFTERRVVAAMLTWNPAYATPALEGFIQKTHRIIQEKQAESPPEEAELA